MKLVFRQKARVSILCANQNTSLQKYLLCNPETCCNKPVPGSHFIGVGKKKMREEKDEWMNEKAVICCLLSTFLHEGRQRGRVVRVPDLKSGDPQFKFRSDH